jgi:glutamate/tyrosine decarboxylase-like PLP-dependent enzyme
MTRTLSLQDRMNAAAADRGLFRQAADHACDYMAGVARQPVFPPPEAVAGLAAFDEALPDGPCDPSAMLALLHQAGSPATATSTGGRYFGFVNGGTLPPALAARWLADAWDQNAAMYVSSPVASRLEAVCERWLAQLLGLPAGCVAGFVGGTSTATTVGLASARQHLLARQGWDVNANGLFGAPPIRVVLGDEAHGTVLKALALLGLGRERVERVPVDRNGRMRAEAMPALDCHTLVIAQAGNVNTGAFDPLEAVCDRAGAAGAWVHVDGAFGLWAAASPRLRHLTAGMDRADSWSVDAHKTLNAPYDCGIVLCRHPEATVAAMQNTGAYIVYSDKRDGMLYTPEMSRRARGVELWATLKALGRSGAAELVEGLCERAAQAARQLREAGFRVLNEVVFNQVLVACDTPEWTQATLQALQASGECWCGGSTWQGQGAIRMSVCSWATTPQDIDRTVAAFVAAREKSLCAQ